VSGRQCRAKSSFVSANVSAIPKRRNQRRSLPTYVSDIVNLASKSPSKQRQGLCVWTPPARGSYSRLPSRSGCDESVSTWTPETFYRYNKELVVDDHLTYGHRKCGSSSFAMSYEDFDIVGESDGHRFPWQKDISIQCCLGDDLNPNGMGYSPAWNSYLPRDRTSSLTRGDIPSHPKMFRPKSTECLASTLYKEDLKKPPDHGRTNLIGRYTFYKYVIEMYQYLIGRYTSYKYMYLIKMYKYLIGGYSSYKYFIQMYKYLMEGIHSTDILYKCTSIL
jgi:hypothetical protein